MIPIIRIDKNIKEFFNYLTLSNFSIRLVVAYFWSKSFRWKKLIEYFYLKNI